MHAIFILHLNRNTPTPEVCHANRRLCSQHSSTNSKRTRSIPKTGKLLLEIPISHQGRRPRKLALRQRVSTLCNPRFKNTRLEGYAPSETSPLDSARRRYGADVCGVVGRCGAAVEDRRGQGCVGGNGPRGASGEVDISW